MSDLALQWRDGEGDLVFNAESFLLDDTLTNAIVISLFTDLRVDGVRGWWGDSFNSDDYQMGSKLWTLSRSKQLSDILEEAQLYAEQSLKWLLDDGVVLAYSVIASNPKPSVLLLEILVTMPDGSTEQRTFNASWSV
ncbi:MULTISPECIES: phage GP46 family protein [Pasteurellaceae]|uniref:phage GP46 family protein n=1 Tax=Pasteurellaceae TaxID=712 RepID=UPI001242CF0B|nr:MULTISPECIES: phage GP46 family protein [Pasteurellaceae]MCW9698209.1 phage GP46 family protein [Avibacterium sp. 20-129]